MVRPTTHPEDQFRELRLIDGTREIFSGDLSVKLTKKEFEILQKLLFVSGRVVERDELLEQVWGPEVHVAGRTIDSHIVKLRRKMKRLSAPVPTIETVWALGYRIIS